MNRFLWLSLCCSLALSSRTATADTLFDSFGTGGSVEFDPIWDVTLYRDAGNIGAAIGASFTLNPGTYSLSSVTLALGIVEGTNNLAISLQADNGGLPSDVPIETLVSHPTDITNLYQVVTYNSSLNPVLAGGVKYWLVLEPIDLNVTNSLNNTVYSWQYYGGSGEVAGKGFDFDTEKWLAWGPGGNLFLPAFRIEGFAVPEPNCVTLFACSALLLWWRSRARAHRASHSLIR